MEYFKVNVCDKSIRVGGKQHIQTLEGHTLPLSIKNGLAYLKHLGAPTDSDLEKYPHVMFTSPGEWDPSILDHEFTKDEITSIPVGDSLELTELSIHNLFDESGEFNQQVIQPLDIILDAPTDPDPGEYQNFTSVHLCESEKHPPDFEALHPFFGWTSADSIQDTFKVAMRYGTTPHSYDYLKKHFKARNPIFIIPRCNEDVVTDTVMSGMLAVDDGSTKAQFFVGRDTLGCDAYGIKT